MINKIRNYVLVSNESTVSGNPIDKINGKSIQIITKHAGMATLGGKVFGNGLELCVLLE